MSCSINSMRAQYETSKNTQFKMPLPYYSNGKRAFSVSLAGIPCIECTGHLCRLIHLGLQRSMVVAEGNIQGDQGGGAYLGGVGLGEGADKGRNHNHNYIKCVTIPHTCGDRRSAIARALSDRQSDQRSLRTSAISDR